MKNIMENWRRLIEGEESSPEVESILQSMEEMSIVDLRVIWKAVADITKRKRNELKAGFKKGDRVQWTLKNGSPIAGTVVRRGGKFVMVQPDGDDRIWKKWPDNLRKVE